MAHLGSPSEHPCCTQPRTLWPCRHAPRDARRVTRDAEVRQSRPRHGGGPPRQPFVRRAEAARGYLPRADAEPGGDAAGRGAGALAAGSFFGRKRVSFGWTRRAGLCWKTGFFFCGTETSLAAPKVSVPQTPAALAYLETARVDPNILPPLHAPADANGELSMQQPTQNDPKAWALLP